MKRRASELEGYRLTVQLHDHPTDEAYRPGRLEWDGRNLAVHVQVWKADDQVSTATWLEAEGVVREALWADAPVETELAVQLLHYDEQLVTAQRPHLVGADVLDLIATEVLRMYLEGVLAEAEKADES